MRSSISPTRSRAYKFILVFCTGLLVGAGVLRAAQHISFVIPLPSAILADGAIYEGDMTDGVINGLGRMRWSNGDRYQGGFKDGLFHGHGFFQGVDGTSYDGEYLAGEATGKGTLVYSENERYSGEVLNSRAHGIGVLESHDTVYEGEFVDSRFHGEGKYTDAQGDTYTGGFKESLNHGHGSYVTSDGRRYTGEFIEGKFTGEGSYHNSDGDSYEGAFLDWNYHGQGSLTNKNGNRSNGTFEFGELHGEGKFVAKNGVSYEGGFEYGRYSGNGKYISQEGNVYIGMFQNGRYNGKGTLTYAQPLDNIDIIEGVWRRGELIEVTNQTLMVNPGIINETVLYNQQALLEKNWAAIEQNDPHKTEMYFLGISGDGSQAVFRREVQFVKSFFDDKLQTGNKSIALINARSTVKDIPLATTTSIKSTLAQIAKRMDVENDILFIYMTSHGSRKFDFSLNQTRMQLPDLSAQALADILEDLQIRWKVIVVSSCFSGGFIPPLKTDNTLIITASAAKKTSFGCSDEVEFTDFGKAYFKDALNENGDFVTAFGRALELVEEREKAKGFEHSQPQIHKPNAIQQQLTRWQSEREPVIETVRVE